MLAEAMMASESHHSVGVIVQVLIVLLAVAGLMAAGPSLAVNKCSAANGKTYFQDLPCDSDSKSEVMKLTPNGSTSNPNPYMVDWKPLLAAAMKSCNLPDLPQNPEIGWTEKRFLECTRYAIVGRHSKVAPMKVNQTVTVNGISKQFVFDHRGSYSYVYTTNGIVTSVQDSN